MKKIFKKYQKPLAVFGAVCLLLLAVEFVLYLLPRQSAAADDYNNIYITVVKGEGKTLSLYEIDPDNGPVLVQTVQLDAHGNAKIKIRPKYDNIYLLTRGDSDRMPPVPLLLERDFPSFNLLTHYDLMLECTSMKNPTAVSYLTISALYYHKHLNRNRLEIERASKIWMENRDSTANRDSLYNACRMQIDKNFSEAQNRARIWCKDYISLLPVYIVNLQLNGRDLFDFETDNNDLDMLLNTARIMNRNIPGNPHVERFLFNLERLENYKNASAADTITRR